MFELYVCMVYTHLICLNDGTQLEEPVCHSFSVVLPFAWRGEQNQFPYSSISIIERSVRLSILWCAGHMRPTTSRETFYFPKCEYA
jgi:hypothetical protein